MKLSSASCLVVAIAATSATLNAASYATPSLTALEGTDWSTGTVRVDFGPLRGMGTVQITSYGGGSGTFFPGNPNSFASLAYPVTDTVLSNGDDLHLDSAVVFSPLNSGATNGGESGFSITFTLDNGTFGLGDVFAAGSLDYRFGINRNTYFQPGSSFGGLDAVTTFVPADGVADLLPVAGSEGLTNGTLYTATGATSTSGLIVSGFGFFRLNSATNQFTTYFTSTGSGQGVALSFATPVPEPSGAAVLSLSGLAVLLRRRRARTA